MQDSTETERRQNQLLAAIPRGERRFLPDLIETVHVELGETLYEAGSIATHVWFPRTAVVSFMRGFADGSSVEVGVVGNEGIVGLHSIFGVSRQPHQALVQSAGECDRISTDEFLQMLGQNEAFRRGIMLYAHAFITQISQTAACNRKHSVDMRLARWLLTMDDRTVNGEHTITQEFLSRMLGVRRAGVNEAMRRLAHEGAVRTRRNAIKIIDREKLHEMSCECYDVVRIEYDRAAGER